MKPALMVLVFLVVALGAAAAGVLVRQMTSGHGKGAVSARATTVPDVESRTIRITAGRETTLKDSQGHVWQADKWFEGGSTISRPELNVAGTKIPELYRAERYSMKGYTIPVANGTYEVKLHFAECYDGNQDPKGRIFNFGVQGKEYKDFSPWTAAGAQFKAYVETVKDVKVADGTLKIKFTAVAENPQICGIEIVPTQ